MGEHTRAGLSLFCGLCLAGMAVLFWFSGSPVFAVVSAVPGLVALLLLANAVHALFASRTPPTTLRFDETAARPGAVVPVVIRQEGPVIFESLRANLVCERIVRGPGKSRTVTYPHQENFFDSGRCEVARLDATEFAASCPIPPDAEPSEVSGTLVVEWRIEVWGKVAGAADFMRPFLIAVGKR